MDGIIGLGHFCETHGPCIILSTQRYSSEAEPNQKPHSLIVPMCEACQSLQLDQAFLSRDSNHCYITTRTPLQQEDAFLMRQAVVRSLSCEQEGTLYFGDNERGHVYSQSFNVHDTLARGFQRKYSIMVLMRNKLTLLNKWSLLSKHIKQISLDLVQKSEVVNKKEQLDKSQKSQRQSEGSPSNVSRSLDHLTGKPGIYAHLHLWFAWILGCPVAIEDTSKSPPKFVIPSPNSYLRVMYQEMGEIFSKVLLLFLNGVQVQCDDQTLVDAFQSLWPSDYSRVTTGNTCCLYKNDNKWLIETKIDVHLAKSRLQKDLEIALGDKRLSENCLGHQIGVLVMGWIHAANVLLACPQFDISLLNSLNIGKNDVAVLSSIVSSHERGDQIISNLHSVLHK